MPVREISRRAGHHHRAARYALARRRRLEPRAIAKRRIGASADAGHDTAEQQCPGVVLSTEVSTNLDAARFAVASRDRDDAGRCRWMERFNLAMAAVSVASTGYGTASISRKRTFTACAFGLLPHVVTDDVRLAHRDLMNIILPVSYTHLTLPTNREV